jgi:hypothetical protein
MPTEYSQQFGRVKPSALTPEERRQQRRKPKEKPKAKPRPVGLVTPVLKALLDAGLTPDAEEKRQ